MRNSPTKPFLDRVEPAVDRLVTHVEEHSDFREPEVATVGAGDADDDDGDGGEHEEGGH